MIGETHEHPGAPTGSNSTTDEFELVKSLQEADEKWERLRQACYDEDLLARGWRRNGCVTKSGRKLIEAAALVDQDVAGALQDALNEPMTRRGDAYVSVLLLARGRFGRE